MLRVRREHALERRDRSRAFRVRLAVTRPVVPRPQVHERFGEDRRRVEVAGILLRQRAHRVGEGPIARLAVVGLARIARGERVDVVALARRSRRGFSATAFCTSASAFGSSSGVHRRVDVGPEHERLPPVGHRAARVEPRRFGERTAGLGVVEAVGEIQPLIDEQLRAGRLRRRPGRCATPRFCSRGASTPAGPGWCIASWRS